MIKQSRPRGLHAPNRSLPWVRILLVAGAALLAVLYISDRQEKKFARQKAVGMLGGEAQYQNYINSLMHDAKRIEEMTRPELNAACIQVRCWDEEE